MCTRPAQFVSFKGKKGAIGRGYDADLVVWNPDEQFTVEPSIIHHRHKLTPYEGRTLFGKVHQTYLRGEKIYDRGIFSDKSLGQKLLRNK